MSQQQKSRGRDRSYDRHDRYERTEKDRSEKDRSEKDRGDTRSHRRRHRSPSYDSSETDSDYSSDSSRGPSPRRRSHRRAATHSDSEAQKYRNSRGRDHRRRDREYHSEESPSRERGGIVDDLLAAVGLLQSKNKSGSHRSGGDSEDRKKHTREALQAALTAAAMEAFRTRKEGKLTPQRLMKIAGAAIAAGGLDAVIDRNGGDGGSMKSIIESVVAGMATSKTMGKSIKHKRDESVGNKVGSGVIGMATKHLTRSLSQGPRRSRTTKY